MKKRIVGLVITAVVVVGVAGAALATSSNGDPAYDLEDTALQLAADPSPAAAGGGRAAELQACVKPKVDAGVDRRTAVRECADQLGIEPKRSRRGRPGPAPRAAHAELVVPKAGAEGQWETIVVDRGKITTATADAISVQRPDGPTVTIGVVPATKVRGAASAAELGVGREVVVVSAGAEARSIVAHR